VSEVNECVRLELVNDLLSGDVDRFVHDDPRNGFVTAWARH